MRILALWNRKVQPNERNLMVVGENSVLVRTGEKNVLIEKLLVKVEKLNSVMPTDQIFK